MNKYFNLRIKNKSSDKTVNVNIINLDQTYYKDGQYLIKNEQTLDVEVKKDPNFKIGRSRLDINKLNNN